MNTHRMISASGQHVLATIEGLVLVPTNGNVGHGHKILPGEHFPEPLTPLKALELMDRDLLPIEIAVDKYLPASSRQIVFDAMCIHYYRMGIGTLEKNRDWLKMPGFWSAHIIDELTPQTELGIVRRITLEASMATTLDWADNLGEFIFKW